MSLGKFKGTWRSDIPAWMEKQPDMKELGDTMAQMMLGDLKVEVQDDQFTLSGYGKKGPQTFTYTVRSASDNKLVLDVLMGGDPNKKGVYEVELTGDNNAVMTLTEPKHDMMVLKRA